jgi:hypothetical protein
MKTTLPPDSEYVRIRDGHITLDGVPVRYWGFIGSIPLMPHVTIESGKPRFSQALDKARRQNRAAVQRVVDLGFNMVRFWESTSADDYAMGDGSIADMKDYAILLFKEAGLKIWGAGPANRLGVVTEDDADSIDDPATASGWREAVRQASRAEVDDRKGFGNKLIPGKLFGWWPEVHGMRLRDCLPKIWDRRLETLGIARIREALTHMNRYTGLTWADDPAFAVWELSNEELWFGRMISGQWQNLPAFFQKQLLDQWNQWLRNKYGAEKELRGRWLGLLPGESLEAGSIILAPIRNDSAIDPQRKALGLNVEDGVSQTVGRYDFNGPRCSDVIEFLMEIWIAHKRRMADAFKQLGKSARLCPLVWDTGTGYEIQTQYLHQHADATSPCTYVTGFHHDPQHRRFPWFSGLEELPRMCWQVRTPWVEQNRMPDKPQFVYETQMEAPSKYRTEWPLRVAGLASIQDWDIVCWHAFEDFPDMSKDRPFDNAMDYQDTCENAINQHGFQYRFDEAHSSAMKAAGEIFKNHLLKQAPSPTTYIFGRKSLLDPASLDYGGSYGRAGETFISTTYRHGVRLVIDPNREDDEIIGPTVAQRQYEVCPIRPTGEITYDWQRGFLRFDGPGVAAYAGFFADYGGPVVFSNGVALRDVAVQNPAGIAYPVRDDERYVTFALVSCDGRPLDESAKVVLSLVSTSFNTGFRLDHDKLRHEFVWGRNIGAKIDGGRSPVLVARVGALVDMPMLDGMRYSMKDWHFNTLDEGAVENGVLRISAGKPVFFVELTRR